MLNHRRRPRQAFFAPLALLAGPLAMTALLLLLTLVRPAQAKPPVLSEIAGSPLPNVFQAGKTYTIKLLYTDPEGDPPRKAQFIYEGPSGRVPKDYTSIQGRDYKNGVVIEWVINGFGQGTYQASFVARASDGEGRFPLANDQNYSFAVESVLSKWLVMGVGLVVGLAFVPFLAYVLARSINRRGDPSRAARIGLLMGILACLALFLYLFLSFYTPLILALGVIAAFALVILVLTRR